MGQLSGTTYGLGMQSGLQSNAPLFSMGGFGPGTMQPWQQVLQTLQTLPQQLQQLHYSQQQQLQYIQQLLQIVPAQLQQIQQLIQILPQQIQHLQQQPQLQSFGQGVPGSFGFGLVPQPFGAQASGQVM
jgi:hypothetical protein